MNKKKTIIILSAVSTVMILIGVYFLIAKPGEDRPRNDSITNNGQYIEKDIENEASIAIAAVEAYAYQDIDESIAKRNDRLKQHFTSDSPVYEYPLDNLFSSITKTVAKSKSVTSCEEQEGGDLCLLVATETDITTIERVESVEQVYWVSVINMDGNYKAFDVGLWQ